MKRNIFLLLVCGCCLSSTINAAIFFVSTDGNDANSGATNNPWRSPGYGSRRLAPGDTLILRAGRYVLSAFDADIVIPPSGQPGAPITIKGEGGTRPVLAGRDNLFAAMILDGKSNLRIENLEITHDEEAGGASRFFRSAITVQGFPPSSNIVVSGIYVHHIDQWGFYAQDIRFLILTNCQFEYCGFGALGSPSAGAGGGWRDVNVQRCRLSFGGHYYEGGDGTNPPNPYDRPDGFGVENAVGPVEITDTIAEHNKGDGLDSKVANTTIRRCIVANNYGDGVKLWGGGRVENTLIYGRGDGNTNDSPWAPVVLSSTITAEVAHYELINVTLDDLHGGGYLLYCNYDRPSVPLHVTLRNCIFSSATHRNSTIWINWASTLVAENNLFSPHDPARVALIHGADVYACNTLFNLDPSNMCGNPDFVAPALGSDGDYHLKHASSAINIGSLVGAPAGDLEGRSRCLAPDAGAFEWAPSLRQIKLGTNGVEFRLTTHLGQRYRIERAPRIGDIWSEKTNSLGTGAEVLFTDFTVPGSNAFYRVVLMCP